MSLDDSVQSIHGIGPKKANCFKKIGIQTLKDALFYMPFRYEDRTKITPISQLIDGEKVSVCAVMATAPSTQMIRKGLEITKWTVFDDSGSLQIIGFNNRFSYQKLQVGKSYLFYGQIQKNKYHLQMLSPDIEEILPSNCPPTGSIIPIYHLSAGLTQRDIYKVIHIALGFLLKEPLVEWIPSCILEKFKIPAMLESLLHIHHPKKQQQIANAQRRFAFEELFIFQVGIAISKQKQKEKTGIALKNLSVEHFLSILPFPPTGAQKRVMLEMIQDLTSGCSMYRLLQGDVGSGKTMIAMLLCFLCAQNNLQSVMIAPTEILAKQHYKTFQPFFASIGFECVLLVGGMSKKSRSLLLEKIKSTQNLIIIGTHAILQHDVEFIKVGGIIVDEQHRFGVNQRSTLSAKAKNAHTLVMSATPIPRTLSFVLYGDLDISILDELPPGRQQIETYAVGEHMRPRIDRFIEKQCADGGQVYIVCPLIESQDDTYQNVQNHLARCKKRFPFLNIAMLHGKMKAEEKDAIMHAFENHQIDVLISTTVIEVGVNIPNTTLMIVENADRFGLSQLHQLRGRVGRGTRQSYCILFGADQNELAKKRLQCLVNSSDGFQIAQADLELRGPGDYFGTRQHGISQQHILQTMMHFQEFSQLPQSVEELLLQNPTLDTFPLLKTRMQTALENTLR